MDFISGEKLTAAKLNNVLQSRCHAHQTTTQTLTTNVSTPITFNAESYDPKSFHSTSVNTARITPTVAGTYKVFGLVAYAPNATGKRVAHPKKNGGSIDSLPFSGVGGNSNTFSPDCAIASGTVSMNGTTDYLELHGNQNTGGNLDTHYSSGGSNSYFIVERIGD